MKSILAMMAIPFFVSLLLIPTPTGVELSGRVAEKSAITFAKNVAPIFQRRCEECHRQGGSAPMAFVTYEQARPWARSIREKVITREMPPFHATGAVGRYQHDPRLSDEEISTIVKWIDSGAAKGNPKEMPPAKVWRTGWSNGEPDLILKVKSVHKVKASPTDSYAFFIFDHVFKEDTWIRSIATHPGNPKVVHHANTHLVPPLFKAPESGVIEGDFDPSARGTIMIAGWVPGTNDVMLPEGTALRIPKGMRFGIQIHYAPTEEEALDETSLGLYLANGTINKNLRMLMGDRKDMEIPPGDPAYSLTSKKSFDTDGLIRFFHVHMHLRGKSYAFRFTYPDGRVETLFDVPKYDFNWQRSYILTDPIRVPKGTQVEFIGTYDNSAKNKFNPDPSKTVYWGPKTVDEMMQGRIFWEAENEHLNARIEKGILVKAAEGK